MIAVWVWTFRDAMEAIGFGLFALFWIVLGAFWLLCKFDDWRKRRARK